MMSRNSAGLISGRRLTVSRIRCLIGGSRSPTGGNGRPQELQHKGPLRIGRKPPVGNRLELHVGELVPQQLLLYRRNKRRAGTALTICRTAVVVTAERRLCGLVTDWAQVSCSAATAAG
jgi:hypothetical protein